MAQSMLSYHRPAVQRSLLDFLYVLLSFTSVFVKSLCSELQLREKEMEREREGGRKGGKEGRQRESEREPDFSELKCFQHT